MTLQSIAEFLAMPIVRKNRVPRLATAIQRLGLSAATASHVILTCRFPVPGEYDFSREIIRCAILQRHMQLAINPATCRDPSERRKDFGRASPSRRRWNR